MKRMSFSETIFLFLLALVIFGPKKLPEIARQAGKLLNEFRRASNEFKSQIEQEIAHLEAENKTPTVLSSKMPPVGTTSRNLSLVPGGEQPPAAVSATSTASRADEDEPLFALNAAASEGPPANGSGSPAAATPPSEPIAPSTSRESHV